MGQLVGLVEVAEFLGVVSQGKRPGNRVWELLKAGKLRGLPYLRIGRRYRFNMAEVEAWVRRQTTANGSHGMLHFR
jgi:excisionase family DNA binding protein